MTTQHLESLVERLEGLVERQAARLDALEHENRGLRADGARLREEVARLRVQHEAAGRGELVRATTTEVSRRGMITAALGAAAATVGAGALLEAGAAPVAAAGEPATLLDRVGQARASLLTSPPATAEALLLGQVNQEASGTEVRYDGGSALSGVLLLANDGSGAGSTTAYKAALGGWAVGGAAQVTTGVYGLSSVTKGTGVVGSDTATDGTGVGVRATSTTGTGLVASTDSTAANAAAVQGTITSTSPGKNSAAVLGQNNGTTGNGIGVYGKQNGSGIGVYGYTPSGIGVVGTTDSTAAVAAAVVGTITSTSPGGFSAGVLGQNNGTGNTGSGVYGQQSGSGSGVYGYTPNGTGVQGTTDSTAGGAAAVVGTITSTSPGLNSAGVLGQNNGTGNNGFGVYGNHNGSGFGVYGHSTSGTAVQGQSDSTASGTAAMAGVMTSTASGSASAGVLGQNNGTGSNVVGVFGLTPSGIGVVGQTGASNGNYAIYGQGNIGATGTKSALVPAEQPGYRRTLYCMESPDCWFEDFGSAQLVAGSARVTLDPLFAATVQPSEYHIFLTPHADSHGLYVSAVDAVGFSVREQQGGQSTLGFSYRIVARRKDVAAPRLALVPEPALPPARPTRPPASPPGAVPPHHL